MFILAVILLLLLTIFIRYFPELLELFRLWRFSKTIPGPSVRELIENSKHPVQQLAWLKELRQKHGPIFGIWFGNHLSVNICDAEDIKIILSSNALLYKSKNYELLRPWLGLGLLNNGGEDWQRRRKMLTPAFHFRILSEFKQPLEENCNVLISKLMDKADGQPFDIFPYITLFALDAICETAMGIRKNAQIQSDSEYVIAVQKICRLIHKRIFSFWERLNFLHDYTGVGKELKEVLKILHGETNRVMQTRRRTLEKENIQKDVKYDDGDKRRYAFLDMLLISQMEGSALTDTDIREEVDTFMFEGHDTTSSTLGFAIYALSQHLEVQRKAYEEAIASEGKEKEPMKYLEAVIKETLRLYPAVPSFGRQVIEDFEIRGLKIPKGASLSILTYIVHRDEKHFPDPEKFDPNRFLENTEKLHPFAHVAFSAGPRNCIGQKFAMLELKCTLASLLRAFEFHPVEGFKPRPLSEIVSKSENGIQVRLKPR